MFPVDFPRFDEGALCSQMNGDLFFDVEHMRDRNELQQLKQVCFKCPSQQPCLDYALKHGVSGVWAGTTSKERADIRKRRGIVAIPLVTGSDV